MASSDDDFQPKTNGGAAVNRNGPQSAAHPPNKKLTVEKIYQKKSQLEHILLRPDTYIGSVQPVTELMWVMDRERERMVSKEIQYVPGLYKIFDEILVNAADNKQRDPKMDTIKIDINKENNTISIWNNGKGIPVVEHKDEKMFVPTMIFGHLLTSSNYDDKEEKVTGGRNGYGAKLCNIFSTKFTVETASKEYKKSLKQTWLNNMSKASEPRLSTMTGEDFTRITFTPDLAKFNMTELEDGIISIMEKRAYDVAASTRGVKVVLNGERLKIKSFKDYCELYLKDYEEENDTQLKIAYEAPHPRWEVAVALSDKGFQQVSFVNSISTTKGGRHVDHVADAIVKELLEVIKKKHKTLQVKPFQVKHHMFLFVNCLIVNPTFDSQTKENMTLQAKSFGSKCLLTQKFMKPVISHSGIIESVTTLARFKEENKLQKQGGKKTNKLKGIQKLEDAHEAGTKNSIACTLILTEGDSAKTLAVAGLGIVGRDQYGVFPLRGKVLNVREASMKQITENAEITNLIKILGLQFKKKYLTRDDLKTLRYGKVMIMTDQDQDGSHIKGLLINFLHFFWPELLRLPFLEEFITPIVKATKGNNVLSFYSLPEFEEWKKDTPNWHKYHVKYYKGLGTSTSNEAKEYFKDMLRHRIKFSYKGNEDDQNICLAFAKKEVDRRKEWLTNWMESCKRRQELGLPEEYLYGKGTHMINYSEFINKELVLFSNTDNERSIPCMVDGLKPGQRKVLYTCLKRNDKREVKVAQLAGSVAEHSSYHHGEASLMSTIINLAQDYVGSNNINLLMPNGQFGTRLQGGKDAASPRYIFTQLNPLTKLIFNPLDTPLLQILYDDNQKIEPRWYIPIIPTILVNGADGIGTGWMTKIHNYNPREIVENLKRLMRGDEPLPMKPWYKNHRGMMESLGDSRYMSYGEVAVLDDERVEITELPVMTWTSAYKESVLEPMSNTTEKAKAVITEFRDYTTDTTVRFVVTMPPETLHKAEETGLHKFFKLQSTLSTSSMCAFDSMGCLQRYESVQTILKDFYTLRLEYYVRRKTYMEGWLQAEALKLTNQARFIVEKCSNKIIVENKKKAVMINELQARGYDPDPERAWKLRQDRDAVQEEEAQASQEDDTDTAAVEYSYLLGLSMWTLTLEKKEELLRKRDQKHEDLKTLQAKSPQDLWNADLDELLEMLDKTEKDEAANDKNLGSKVLSKAAGKGKGKGEGKVMKFSSTDIRPSPTGRRIVPAVDEETKKKIEKLDAAKLRPPGEKGKRGKKKTDFPGSDEQDEIDTMIQGASKSLKHRLGTSPAAIEQKMKKGDGLKQSKLNFTKKGSPKKSKKPWESDESSGDLSSDGSHRDIPVPERERPGQRRAATKQNFKEKSSDESDEDLEFQDTNGAFEADEPMVDSKIEVSDTDDEFQPTENMFSTKSKPKPKSKPDIYTIDSDSDSDNKRPTDDLFMDKKTKPKSKPKPQSKKQHSDSDSEDSHGAYPPAKSSAPKQSSDQMFDSLLSPSKSEEDSAKTSKSEVPVVKKAAPKKRQLLATSDKEKPAKKRAPAKKKVKKGSDSDSEENLFIKPSKKKGGDSDGDEYGFKESDSSFDGAARTTTGRQRKPVNYKLYDDDSE